MLDLEVVPERSLGCEQWEFILGMHFSQAVAIIQSQVGLIKSVQVIYSDTNPLSTDLELNLSQDGIRLKFDPVSQRLKLIEIYNMKLVNLKYCGCYFNSSEVSPSIEQIEHSFGATHPGEFDGARQVFTLSFRGLSFTFPASKAQSEFYTGVGRSKCPGVSPLASLVCLYSGRPGEAPPLPLSCYLGQLYLDRCLAINDKALKLYLYTEGASLEPRRESLVREIWLGDSCQALAVALGAPHRVFYKSEDKMKIHSPGPSVHRQPHRSDYFFNYFSLGLDVLFDARTHKAKKFVLHTNYPGHYNFNMYHRCEFLLSLPVEPKDSCRGLADSCRGLADSQLQVTAYTKWDSISDSLRHSQRPVVLNRASSVNTKNCFGATLCYGYRGIIFEVMANQHIASVTIYNGEGLEL